jgi:putative flippase GtrA
MEQAAYKLLESMESSWWYRGRTKALFAALKRAGNGSSEAALDYGAGYGGASSFLGAIAKERYAYEPESDARAKAMTRGYRDVFSTEEEAFARTYNLIGLFDVLEHIEDDKAFLSRAQNALAAEGSLVLTVPAFMFLWSAHDVEHHHFRRYTVGSLKKLLESEGYSVAYASYWNCSLLLPAAVLRLLGNSGGGGLTPHPLLNALFTFVVSVEAAILRWIPLPFGLSIVMVARKAKEKVRKEGLVTKIRFLLRYGISGLTGALIQVVSLYVWVSVLNLKDTYLLGLVVGFVLALIASFLLQKYWAFRDNGKERTPIQFVSYSTVALSGLTLNALLLAGARELSTIFSIDFFQGWYMLAQVFSVGVVSVFNFSMNFLFTFKHARRTGTWKKRSLHSNK